MACRDVYIFESAYSLSNFLLEYFCREARSALNQNQAFTVALSGGKTPVEFYSRLSTVKDEDLWRNIHLFQADERFVPPTHPDNNFHMITESLIDYLSIPEKNLHPVHTQCDSVQIAADLYKEDLLMYFLPPPGEVPVLDMVILGIGQDGHTASLFPGGPGLDNAHEMAVAVEAGDDRHARISLSLAMINHARNIVVQVAGADKADILSEIIDHSRDCPASRLEPVSGRLIFLADRAAARRLNLGEKYSHDKDAIVIRR